MLITLRIGEGAAERTADVRIAPGEVADVHLHVAHAAARNRTGLYMRRHPVPGGTPGGTPVGPDRPLRDPAEPPRMTVPEHVATLRQAGAVPGPADDPAGNYRTEPVMLAVPVSDVVANLFRPAYHRDGLGSARVFFLDAEPIDRRSYWCACRFEGATGAGLDLRWVRFDPAADRVLGSDGRDLAADGLVWAVALVPLVENGHALDAAAIACRDYDLRQVLGRDSGDAIRYAYEGFPGRWDERVAEVVAAHERSGRPFATFYHSVLAFDGAGNLLIRQAEGTLPGLAADLAAAGVRAAGLLDSGGSCALYDPWLGFLNHGWYYREPRGAILLFTLHSPQRLPGAATGAG